MRANRKEPESAIFWYQSLSFKGRPHGGLLHRKILEIFTESRL
jgi:hypothetical protein